MRDFQKQRCYDWEREVVRNRGLDRPIPDHATALWVLNKVWDRYAMHKPRVHCPRHLPSLKLSTRAHGSYYHPVRHHILLGKPFWGWHYSPSRFHVMSDLLHEIAHALEHSQPNHGPLFVRTVARLYAQHLGHSEQHLLLAAKDCGLQVASSQATFGPKAQVLTKCA